MSNKPTMAVAVTSGGALSADHADIARQQMEAAIKAWLSGKSEHTIRASLGDLRLFATFVRGEDIEDPVDAAIVLFEDGQLAAEAAIADWRADMRESDHQPTSIARRIASLRSLANTMKRFGLGWDLSDVRGPSYSPYARATGPGADAVKAKLDELGQLAVDGDAGHWKTLIAARDYAMLVVLYHTGMRRSSLVGLTWDEMHLGGSRPYVRAVVKGGKTRRMPLSRQCVEALQQWRRLRVSQLGRYAKRDRVFCGVIGTKAGETLTADSVYKRLKYSYGLSGPHGIRHTTATTIFEKTGNLRHVQSILGHRNAATSQSYMDEQGHSTDEAMRVIAEEEPL
ncbi:MAG: tyrosine-type recombinase/integrase [Nannocystaceae bacterium]|nr:tyrosine-type recombinase/integrase [bacterium]